MSHTGEKAYVDANGVSHFPRDLPGARSSGWFSLLNQVGNPLSLDIMFYFFSYAFPDVVHHGFSWRIYLTGRLINGIHIGCSKFVTFHEKYYNIGLIFSLFVGNFFPILNLLLDFRCAWYDITVQEYVHLILNKKAERQFYGNITLFCVCVLDFNVTSINVWALACGSLEASDRLLRY